MGFFGSAAEKQPQKEIAAAPASPAAKAATADDNLMAVIAAAVAACADDGAIAAIAAAIALCTESGAIASISRLDGGYSWTRYARVAAVTARNEMF